MKIRSSLFVKQTFTGLILFLVFMTKSEKKSQRVNVILVLKLIRS